VLVSYFENGANGYPWIKSLCALFKVENNSLITETDTVSELWDAMRTQVDYYNCSGSSEIRLPAGLKMPHFSLCRRGAGDSRRGRIEWPGRGDGGSRSSRS